VFDILQFLTSNSKTKQLATSYNKLIAKLKLIVMGNELINYLNKRLKKENPFEKGKLATAGPVITISREVGCNGIKLAKKIACRLNEQRFLDDWRVLSKEIFQKSAKELEMDTEHVMRVFTETEKYSFEEIIKAFNNRNFKSERQITNTVKDIVRSCAVEGFAIIVGRAGHILASDIKNAFHIRLVAPLEYRIKVVQEKNDLNRENAIEYIQRVEKERIAFRKAFTDDNFTQNNFDMVLNRASFSDDDIVDIIENSIIKKGILNDARPKVQYY